MLRTTLATVLALAAAGAAGAETAATASATLKTAEGAEVGTVTFSEGPNGVLVRLEGRDMPAGSHGFHIHQTGACEPDFKAAGEHFNPGGAEHGFMNEAGPHAGDLPNIHVGEDGAAMAEFVTDMVSLEDGAENTLFDEDGAAMIVHANPDSYEKEAGAGDRIACGVIERTGA